MNKVSYVLGPNRGEEVGGLGKKGEGIKKNKTVITDNYMFITRGEICLLLGGQERVKGG